VMREIMPEVCATGWRWRSLRARGMAVCLGMTICAVLF